MRLASFALCSLLCGAAQAQTQPCYPTSDVMEMIVSAGQTAYEGGEEQSGLPTVIFRNPDTSLGQWWFSLVTAIFALSARAMAGREENHGQQESYRDQGCQADQGATGQGNRL